MTRAAIQRYAGWEALPHAIVVASLGAATEAGAPLRQGDERQEDPFGQLHAVQHLTVAGAEVAVAVGVQRESQRHSSGSTWSIASMAWSNSGSSTQVPARSSRS